MNKLGINFENCYGIGKLDFVFDFSNTNSFLIYAPNGMMKTSFAKTLKYFNNDAEAPCDQIYSDRKPKFEVKFDDVLISPQKDQLLIIDPEVTNYDGSHSISNFIASKDLKDKFDAIFQEIDSQKKNFITKLKNTSISSDCESEVISTFQETDKDTFLDVLEKIRPELNIDYQKFEIKYNNIFDKDEKVKKFLEKHKDNIDIYVEKYEELISQSDFFQKSGNSFGTYQAGTILKSTADNSFFEAGHTLTLRNSQTISSAEEFKTLLDQERDKISEDSALKEIFEKINKDIESNIPLRDFQKELESNNLLLVELKDYEAFKKKVWLGFLCDIKQDALDLYDFYISKKQDLDSIFSEAEKEVDIWKGLVDLFNTRFHVPFTVSLVNQKDVILKKDLPVLEFLYSDKEEEDPVVQDRGVLFDKILSRGEKRAFYILQILFDIESKKSSLEPTLVVFDDVADSFDYRNKYAIIEYIKDLHDSDNFRLLLLTHNFDFYRTVWSRLYLSRDGNSVSPNGAILMSTKSTSGEITLNQGQYVEDLFKYFLKNADKEKYFVSLIPFLRNIIEFTEGHDADYDTLTKCLHVKDDTDQVLVDSILGIWKKKFPSHLAKFDSIAFGTKKIKDLIYEVAASIILNPLDEVALENKIPLAIAVRLIAEDFILKKLPSVDTSQITRNQTQELLKMYKDSGSASDKEMIILNKVNLMTPENIHLNSFMYEPLIDITSLHLVGLYKDIKDL